MKIDLNALCDKVEATVPTARATAVPEINQVIVSFENRPDVEVALLIPSLQRKLQAGTLKTEDLSDTLFSICRIADT